MSNYKQREFERAVKHGTDVDIREAARNLSYPSHDIQENTDFMAEQLREHKRSQVRGFGDETKYDGVDIRTGSFPRIRVDKEPEPELEWKRQPLPEYQDDDEDEDYDQADQEDFDDDDEEDWED